MSAQIKDSHDKSMDFLTILIAKQRFGIPVMQVQDVLGEQSVTTIPLAPPEVAGSLNLRGRVVTAIDVRCRLGLDPCNDDEATGMSVVVEHDSELYSLIIDRVGDVLTLNDAHRVGIIGSCLMPVERCHRRRCSVSVSRLRRANWGGTLPPHHCS